MRDLHVEESWNVFIPPQSLQSLELVNGLKELAVDHAVIPQQVSRTCPGGINHIAGCGKSRFEADAVPRNSLVSTAQPDKKKVCVDKTSSSWMCSATLARSSEYPKSTPCARFVS